MEKSEKRAWAIGAIAAAITWCGLSLCYSQVPPPSAENQRTGGITLEGEVKIPADWTFLKPDVSRTVIYLASAKALDAVPPPVAPAVVAQRNKAFDPPFSVISEGTSVEFPNWDHFDHNVFSRSPAAPAFDLARYPYGQSKAVKFGKIGAVQLFCNIHPDMRAVIFVAPNPFFTRADGDGHFAIPNVPPGDFELVAWNERCTDLHQKITVTAGPSPQIPLTLHEDRGVIAENPASDKNQYGVERGLSVKRETLNLPVIGGAHPAPVPAPADSVVH